jgi:hypothetical protein
MVTAQDARVKLLETRDGLEREQGELLLRLSDAADREHAARVDALTADPAHRSDAKGAASPVWKILESTARDEARLTNVEAELRAVDVRLAQLDTAEADRVRADLVKAGKELRRREQAALDEARAAKSLFDEKHALLEAVQAERRDLFGGTSDPELQPLLPPAATSTPSALFAHLASADAAESEEPSFAPKPAPRQARWFLSGAVTLAGGAPGSWRAHEDPREKLMVLPPSLTHVPAVP